MFRTRYCTSMEPSVKWPLVLLAMVTPAAAVWGNFEKEYIGGYERGAAFVHLMEWSYDDIRNECASLDWNGYYGIIISPPVEHVEISDNPGWKERYMPISVTNFKTRSGTEDQLKAMMRRCYNWNRLRVIVDINLNNMLKTTSQKLVGFGGTEAIPSQFKYDGLVENQFYPLCDLLTPEDWQDEHKLRKCRVDGLQDLDNSHPVLQRKHEEMMNRLVAMGIFGFRITMARHMYPGHLYTMYLNLKKIFTNKDKPFIIHDINDLDNSVIKSKHYKHIGMVTDYEYGYEIYKYFTGKPDRDLNKLLSWDGIKLNSVPKARGAEPLVFLYNHENKHQKEGVLTPRHGKAYRMGLAFMMAFPYGIPMVLSSYMGKNAAQNSDGTISSPRPSSVRSNAYYYECTNNFVCEHRLDTTIMMSIFKAEVRETKLSWFEKNEEENWFAFARGDRGFIFFNAGTTSLKKRFTKLPLKAGDYCDLATGEIINYGTKCTGDIIRIEKDQSATIALKADSPYGYVAIMTRMWLDPKKTAVANVVNFNIVTRTLFGLPGKLLGFVGNAAMEAGERITETYNDPEAGMTQVVGSGVGAVGYKVYTGIADMIEELGRRLLHKLKNMFMDAAQTVVEDQLKRQLDGALGNLNIDQIKVQLRDALGSVESEQLRQQIEAALANDDPEKMKQQMADIMDNISKGLVEQGFASGGGQVDDNHHGADGPDKQ